MSSRILRAIGTRPFRTAAMSPSWHQLNRPHQRIGSLTLGRLNSSTPPPKIEPKLSLTFTCTAPDCSTRSSHTFTKRSYERGIVLVECPGCKNRHLIADHLGWFKDSTEGGKLRTVEDILRARGESVRRGKLDVNAEGGGVLEFSED
ncbi:DNL zinc finger-domain-containing protein [Hygrophoropsis aurantiaca]|uniref:DNL zinc finger-domain-containing protein n=1 Tax=Hygrophoropsis aurantiaca TaxID=72124 RepID=A0ACB8A6D2_9AGAM|nr:DNL zinc finger-domain-containing protein [Hygrophoropsis aurantiaca]